MEESKVAREQTILILVNELGEQLADLQGRLDSRFKRNYTKEDCPNIPLPDNVLDEIINKLENHRENLAKMLGFISSQVLSKISE